MRFHTLSEEDMQAILEQMNSGGDFDYEDKEGDNVHVHVPRIDPKRIVSELRYY